MKKYAIVKSVGMRKTLVSTHQGKYEAVVALQELCDSLDGYRMWTPIELWKVNSHFGISHPTKNTAYTVEPYKKKNYE